MRTFPKYNKCLESTFLLIPNWLGSSFTGKNCEVRSENKRNPSKYILL